MHIAPAHPAVVVVVAAVVVVMVVVVVVEMVVLVVYRAYPVWHWFIPLTRVAAVQIPVMLSMHAPEVPYMHPIA